MKLDISKPENLSSEDVARLLGSVDDSVNRELRVTKEGIAYIVEADDEVPDDELFRFTPWIRGNSFTGNAAAKDGLWIAKVEQALRNNWPKPEETVMSLP